MSFSPVKILLMAGLFLPCLSLHAKKVSEFERRILDRNGDVYVLITSKTGNALAGTGLFKFTRVDNYARALVDHPEIKKNVNIYSGLSVDKFGHISLFRDEGDTKPIGLLEEIQAGTHKLYPGETGWPGPVSISARFNGGGLGGPMITRNASPPGWVYVVEPNGKYGWFNLYGTSRVGLRNGPGGNGYVYGAPKKVFPAGTEMIPQGRDQGFNNFGGAGDKHGGRSWYHAIATDYVFSQDSAAAPTELFYPPIHAFWVTDAAHRGGRNIYDVEKSVTALYLDKFLTKPDNNLLATQGKADPRFKLKEGIDYFDANAAAGTDVFQPAKNALNTSLSFSQKVFSYNVCYDMCGSGGQAVAQAPIVVNEGRAKFSSGGASTQLQRSYMVKTASRNQGTKVVTSVVQLAYDGTEYAQTDILEWNGGTPPAPAKVYTETVMDSGANNTNVIVYQFGAAQGASGEFAKAVQTSRRVKGGDETKDYVYISNLPFSHFNVSESFWGTGGVVWWAIEKPGKNLELHFEQKNHQHPNNKLIIGSGNNPVVAKNVEALQAIGADGDNFIYILHGGAGTDGRGGLETPEDMARLVMPATRARLDALFKEGKLIEAAPAFPLTGSLCATPAGPCEFTVTLKRSAGLVLEKIAPLAGSKPVRIGLLPLADTGGTCQAILQYPGTSDAGGTVSVPFTCTGGAAADALQNFNIEMAVINVANPPATGGNPELDIVNAIDESKEVYVEDKEYSFFMENPPKFNGPFAQLGLVPNPELNIYDLVQMASNYDETGINAIKEGLTNPLDMKRFYDEDGRVGRLLPSYIWRDLKPGQGMISEGKKSLRWRWRVIAKTPPHSNRDYTVPLPGEVSKVKVCTPLLGAAAKASESNVKKLKEVKYLDALNVELGMNPVRGVMQDTCWKDLEIEDRGMVRPEEFKVTFPDPGEYEVWLMFGGLRFNADDLTFLDSPTSVEAETTVTWYIKTVHVGAKIPQPGNEITDVVIVNNDLNADKQTRAGLYPNSGDMFLATDPHLDKPHGDNSLMRAPILPTANYKAGSILGQPLVVTHEKQHTPIVAEAEIQLFQALEVEYVNIGGGEDSRQTKTIGVGAWDYVYPGGGRIAGYPYIDKTQTFPANHLPAGGINRLARLDAEEKDVPTDLIRNRRGNDASGDPATSAGFSQVAGRFFDLAVPNSGLNWTVDQFSQAHQGTLATCRNFQAFGALVPKASEDCRIRHPEFFYTWWEIKYAWFMRYRKPDGTVHKKVIKTGNLGEVFALHFLANYAAKPEWQHVVRNLAPHHLSNDSWNAFQLMKDLGSGKVRIRVPLMAEGGLLNGNDVNEMHASLKDLDAMGADFKNIYNQVHPVAFQVPSAPAVIEIGFQLFYPIMNWEGRDKVKGADGTERFAYFDAVYWGPESEKQCAAAPAPAGQPGPARPGDPGCVANPDDNKSQIAEIKFGKSDPLKTWARFAKKKPVANTTGFVDPEMQKVGLVLAGNFTQGAKANTGGFRHTGGANLAYDPPGGGKDDFVDIVVLDQTRPILRPVSGTTLAARAGGRVAEDIILEAEDNNPFSLYRSHTQIGEAPVTKSPALVHFAYEIGGDTRNHFGVGLYKGPGLADRRAYGFNLSHVGWDGVNSLSTTDMAKQPQYAITDALAGRPFTVLQPGYTYAAGDIGAGDFYYPAGGSGFHLVRRTTLTDNTAVGTPYAVAHHNTKEWQHQRLNSADTLYYAPDLLTAAMKQNNLRDKELGLTRSADYRMLSFIPNIPEDPYNFTPVYNSPSGASYDLIRFVEPDGFTPASTYKRFDPGCLKDAKGDPIRIEKANLDACKVITRWRIPKETIIAPYFVNPSDSQTFDIYAKVRDIRYTPEVPDVKLAYGVPAVNAVVDKIGGWPDWNFQAFELRKGVENGDETGGATLAARVANFMDSETMRHGTKVSAMTVTDNAPPNFRVIISEAKFRTQVEYTVMDSQGFEVDKEPHSDRILFFRTQDPRGTMDNPEAFIFASASIPASANPVLNETRRGDLRVHQLLGAGQNTHINQVYRIPEDVRFEIRVVAGDNRSLDEMSIRISGGHTGLYSPHPEGYQSMEEQYKFPATVSSAGRVYQQMKFASAFHLYPKAQYYDVIKVEVFDSPGFSGNSSVLHIPVEVIDQKVFFRQIGSDRKSD
ncbi:MAG: hypothetical protein H3C47_12380 [Candidatus Cloacimonetes bacterium]|nr:hypothetical protein [Candidatus Cloacimonadota bacterium]